MLKKTWYHFLTSIIFIVSIYYFYQQIFIVSVPLLALGVMRLGRVSQLPFVIDEVILPSEIERKVNLQIDIQIDLSSLMKHPEMRRLYDKLLAKADYDKSFEDWGREVISEFNSARNNQSEIYKVSFNLKNGDLFKNDEPCYLDTLYDEIYLPQKIPSTNSKFPIEEYKEIAVRVIVVNGSLNLEIGKFTKELSPIIYKDSALGAYRKYQKISSFPLMMIGYRYGIPGRYMNSNFNVSEQYKNIAFKSSNEDVNDWREFNRKFRIYKKLLSGALDNFEGIDVESYISHAKVFQSDFQNLIKMEGFTDPFGFNDADPQFPWDEGTAIYANDWLQLNFYDWAVKLETFQRISAPDYIEERI